MRILIKDIERKPEVQLRDGLDMERVNAMVEFEAEGGKLPPVTVVGDTNLLADGHHRVYAAERSGRVDVEANRKPGGVAEAIAISLSFNDSKQSMPLTRVQRNAGIKALLKAGWSQVKIAKATGVHQTTIMDIQNALAMRGQLPKRTKAAGTTGGRKPKPVAVLPKAVHEKLSDTTLTRIADVPVEQQTELAEAVASTGLTEPRTREAIKALRADSTLTPTAAVASVAPGGMKQPVLLDDVAKQVRRRLKTFLADTMTVGGKDYDFWQVLDVLVAHLRTEGFAGDLHADGLADLLAEVSVLSDKYATALRSTPVTVAPVAIGAAR